MLESNRSSPPGERNQHLIFGIEFIDDLDPFQIWADLVLFEVCDPQEEFLHA